MSADDAGASPEPGRATPRRRRQPSIRARLLRWYTRHHRDLPWRHTRDPYCIWVSEAMLQQTRVETVIPYYHRFLDAFPDVESLATADLDDVLGHWAGLGYYSRARNLKRAAEEVVSRFASALPADLDELQSLPGVGRYTAGAIASIAFDQPAPIVDGNVARVLCRVLALEGAPNTRAVQAVLWREAEALARGPRPGDLNQAMMELGARICVPRSPRCEECPIAAGCAAYRTERVHELPHALVKKAPKRERWIAALLLRRGRALAVRRPAEGSLGGLWELPGGVLAAESRGERGLAAARSLIEERTGLRTTGLRAAGRFEYAFTHRQLQVQIFRGALGAGRTRLRGYDKHRWVAPEEIGGLPIAALTRRALDLLLGESE